MDYFLAYMAGFVDGEGCIRIGHNKSKGRSINHRLELIVSNTDDKPLLEMQKRFGGHVRSRRYDALKYWTLYNDAALEVIRLLRPYLITKAEQADVAIEYMECKTKCTPAPGKRLPAAEVALREAYAIRIKELKIVKPVTTTKEQLVYTS